MDKLRKSVQTALESEAPIPRQLVREWIQRADSVQVDAMLYTLTGEAWNRIQPPLDREETCALIRRYLLRCIRENPEGGRALRRYEAAGELEGWFDHLAHMKDTHHILQDVAAAVTDLFLNSDEEIRKAIETGFLEHVLEQRPLRPLFANWAHEKRLMEAWQRALAWGDAHPDYMKTLRAGLRDVQSGES